MAVLDKIKGIFTGDDDKQLNAEINTPEQQKLVDMVLGDFTYFRADRQKIEPTWAKEGRFYMGDQWSGLRPQEVSDLRPNSIDNVAWSQIESIVARLCGWVPKPDFEGQEPGDEQKAADLNAYMPWEIQKIGFKQKHVRAVRRMVVHGPLIYKTIHDPTVQGGRGQNLWEGENDVIPLELGSFFPDPRIRDFIYLQRGKAHIIKTPQALEYFKERWDKQGEKVKADNANDDTEIFDRSDYSMRNFNTSSGSGDGFEQKTAGLIEYWYKGKPKYMDKEQAKMFREMAEQKMAEGIDPREWMAKSKGAMDGVHCIYVSTSGVFLEHKSYVYEHGQYPIVARILFPDEGSIWGKGYMRDMMSPQIMLNKFAEIAVDTMAKQGNGGIMYEEDAITKPEKWAQRRSLAGAMLPVAPDKLNGVRELQGVNVPNTVFQMLQYYKEMLQKIPGQFDSANGQASANVTSGAQAQALINASSGRLALPADIIQDALQEVFKQYIALIGQFYTGERIGRVTGKTVTIGRDMIMSHAPVEMDKHPLTNEPLTDDFGNPATMQMQEEYVPDFDISVNIRADKPQDAEYAIQTAYNLYKLIDPATGQPAIDLKAVLYAVENGRLEPFSVIEARMQKEQQMMQQMQELQAQNQQLQQENQAMQGAVVESEAKNMQSTQNTLKLLQESDDKQHRRNMDMQKMDVERQKVAAMAQRNMG